MNQNASTRILEKDVTEIYERKENELRAIKLEIRKKLTAIGYKL
ncbi:hypothetical protein ACOKFD_16330 [Flagellimonas sp. S174]